MFWRTEDGVEVDFIIEKHAAIEVKSTSKVCDSDLKALKILRQDPQVSEHHLVKDFYLVSNDPVDRLKDGIHLLHYDQFNRKSRRQKEENKQKGVPN